MKSVFKIVQSFMKEMTAKPVLFSLTLMGIMLICAEVFARAGGGGNYSGGGGGGGFSGGGGGGDGIGALLYLAILYPEVGVPVIIIVIVASAFKHKFNPDRTTAKAVKQLENIAAPSTAGLGSIKDRDSAFDADAFLEKVKEIDFAVQDAWCHGDMSPVRGFLSDGLFRQFEGQLRIMKHQGIRNAMADHEISQISLHAVDHDDHFDTLHVAIEASAKDVEVDASLSYEEATAKARRARKEQYTEIWSFLRRPGARTLASGGAIEGMCPNCGAPVKTSQTTKCEHCQALINSGDYDWVLAEITQPLEWRPSSTGQVPGLVELSQSDPKFNRQAAEDRGSYIFWRWIEAQVKADAGALSKCSTKDFQGNLVNQLKSGEAKLFKTAVGSVDLVACELGKSDGRDRFFVKIFWSSAQSATSAPRPAASVLVLSRKAGAKDPGGLSYSGCPVCQGPLSENDSPSCEYCGADLAAGDTDWVLERVMRPEEVRVAIQPVAAVAGSVGESDTEVPVWATPDMGNQRERTLLLMRMAAVVMADGIVTRQERRLLKSASKRWGVSLEVVQPILSGEVNPNDLEMMRPSNPDGFLSGLISAALIDGRIDYKEEKLLLDVGRNLGISDAATKNMMNTMTKMAKARKTAV